MYEEESLKNILQNLYKLDGQDSGSVFKAIIKALNNNGFIFRFS